MTQKGTGTRRTDAQISDIPVLLVLAIPATVATLPPLTQIMGRRSMLGWRSFSPQPSVYALYALIF
jgi:hypothetical protein